eukprot:Amastigsp_a511439_18.p3 type:complete len:130 gc:universal Amastigsp_a511439_18:518-129(-)
MSRYGSGPQATYMPPSTTSSMRVISAPPPTVTRRRTPDTSPSRPLRYVSSALSVLNERLTTETTSPMCSRDPLTNTRMLRAFATAFRRADDPNACDACSACSVGDSGSDCRGMGRYATRRNGTEPPHAA